MNRVYLGVAADPETKTCDWCGAPGVKALEIYKPRKKVGSGQFLYPCSEHVRVAERTIEGLKKPKEKAT